MHQYEELVDYRRRVAEIYARMRNSSLDREATWKQFCEERSELFAAHPLSPLTEVQKKQFSGLHYFPYDENYCFSIPVVTSDGTISEVALQDDGTVRMSRFGTITLAIDGKEVSLSLFWILGYGGGVFLPFRDATSGQDTYGGGRYLLDTIKHADLGRKGSGLVIDFNYSFNPSCAYNPRWHCPLSPPENTLPVGIRAGEKGYLRRDRD